jgi:hypothetical protein
MVLTGKVHYTINRNSHEEYLKKMRENPHTQEKINTEWLAKNPQPLYTKRVESTVVYTDDNDFHIEAHRQEQAKQQGPYTLHKYLSKR